MLIVLSSLVNYTNQLFLLCWSRYLLFDIHSFDLGSYHLLYQCGKLIGSHHALVALALCAYRHCSIGLLLLTNDDKEGDSFELVIADFPANLLVTAVNLSANIAII